MMNSNEKKDIQVFWALRFFAFLLIYIHHTPELNRFIREPDLAVLFFVIISGFLNGLIYSNKYKSIRFNEIFAFMKNKIKKIYPIHLLMFLITIPLTGVFGFNTLSQLFIWGKRAISNITLTQSWINNSEYYFSFNGVSWFLSMFLFLLIVTIPFIALLNRIKKCKHNRLIMVLITAVLVVINMVYIFLVKKYNLEQGFYLYIFPLSKLPTYLISVVAGFLLNDSKKILKGNNRFLWTLIEIGAIIPIILFILFKPSSLGILNSIFDTRVNWWTIPIFVILIIYKNENGYISKIIGNKAFSYLGKLSMILFLIHEPIISYGVRVSLYKEQWLNRYAMFYCYLIISIVFAYIINKGLVYRKDLKT